MTDELLIDQALAAVEAAKPIRLGDSVPVTPHQALAYAVYTIAQALSRGHGTDTELERAKRDARNAGIPEREIEAAVERAQR